MEDTTMFGIGTDAVPIAFILGVALTLVSLTRIISDGITRRRLLKGGATPDLARAIAAAPEENPRLYGTLRWGIVTGAAGIALILIQFLPYRANDPLVLGVLLVFIAAGLLAYFASARWLMRTTQRGGAA
jgi:uncharacterized membrane protein YedE/YeeE